MRIKFIFAVIYKPMAKSGPIVVLEDDLDDRETLKDILEELKVDNKLIWFSHADEALQFLQSTTQQPFIIFSDVNLPGKNGIEFKRIIDADPELRKKSIPFIFYSTSAGQSSVDEAYTNLTVQGFFKKSVKYQEVKKNIQLIIEYWRTCIHPNTN